MSSRSTVLKRRRWAGIVVILLSIILLLLAVWPGAIAGGESDDAARNAGAWFATHAIAGALGILSIVIALRSQKVARLLLAFAGVVALSGLLFDELGVTGILTSLVPGLVFLALSPLLGAMPTPEDEGNDRSPLPGT